MCSRMTEARSAIGGDAKQRRKDFRKNVFEGGDKRVSFPAQEKLIAERVLQQRELHVRVTHRGHSSYHQGSHQTSFTWLDC